MSEFLPVRTKADLDSLDDDDILAGYRAGMAGQTNEPGSDKSRAYWHGWRNAMVDRGVVPIDAAQMQLVRDVAGTYRGLN